MVDVAQNPMVKPRKVPDRGVNAATKVKAEVSRGNSHFDGDHIAGHRDRRDARGFLPAGGQGQGYDLPFPAIPCVIAKIDVPYPRTQAA